MRALKVEWLDSKRCFSEWTHKDELVEPDLDVLRVVSLGFVVHEDDDMLVIAANDGGDQVVSGMAIPRRSIITQTEF